MFFQRFSHPTLSINSYLIGDKESGLCCIIDPIRYVTPLIVTAENADLTIAYILETHVHADFVSGAVELKNQLGGNPKIYCSAEGGEAWIPTYADVKAREGEVIYMGSIRLEALHTPGHTQEHMSWICYDESRSQETPWFIFTGDFIFVGGVGRPDLYGPAEAKVLSEKLYDSLFNKVLPLPDFTEVFPAHGEGSLCGNISGGSLSSTMGYERRFNPYFADLPLELWATRVLENQKPFPSYFKRVKQINLKGATLLEELKIKEIQEKEINSLSSTAFLLDIRHPAAFAQCHIEGSVNIPFTASYGFWVGWLVPDDKPIILIAESESRLSGAIEQLRLMGIDQTIFTYVLASGTIQQTCTSESLKTISVVDLAHQIQEQTYTTENMLILDVRSESEYDSGHIQGAHHISLEKLIEQMGSLPQDQTIATICRTGQRSSTAASLLKKYGFKNILNVKGGMSAWKQVETGG